jgi:Fe-Mn family superoxide dismutase
MENNRTYPFTPEKLDYKLGDLEPFIDAKTMQLHYDRHYTGYINALNEVLARYPELHGFDLKTLLDLSFGEGAADIAPDDRVLVSRNAGGVLNHEFFFKSLRQATGEIIIGRSQALANQIARDFGDWENFKAEFAAALPSVFGSGYLWLAKDAQNSLHLAATSNQTYLNSPNLTPIFCVDLWEHAYYLKNYNARADYLNNLWHVIDWHELSERFAK